MTPSISLRADLKRYSILITFFLHLFLESKSSKQRSILSKFVQQLDSKSLEVLLDYNCQHSVVATIPDVGILLWDVYLDLKFFKPVVSKVHSLHQSPQFTNFKYPHCWFLLKNCGLPKNMVNKGHNFFKKIEFLKIVCNFFQGRKYSQYCA